MILQTGLRTDIPAFYAKWLANRIQSGFVCVRNPYNPAAVTRYVISPEVVDLIGFCTKNPTPMFPYLELLKPCGQYWFVTITPYGKDIEPNVPNKKTVMDSFRKLSDIVGIDSIAWRYDPILITEYYSMERHISYFEKMSSYLSGFTNTCVISFIDVYKKVKNNFPEVRAVSLSDCMTIGKAFAEIGNKYGIKIKSCAEGNDLASCGVDCSGCMTVETFETALHRRLNVPKKKSVRSECACYLGNDIGAYNTCGHLCRYCYANINAAAVRQNFKRHNPNSPFLIGNSQPGDKIYEATQKSWIDNQITLL